MEINPSIDLSGDFYKNLPATVIISIINHLYQIFYGTDLIIYIRQFSDQLVKVLSEVGMLRN